MYKFSKIIAAVLAMSTMCGLVGCSKDKEVEEEIDMSQYIYRPTINNDNNKNDDNQQIIIDISDEVGVIENDEDTETTEPTTTEPPIKYEKVEFNFNTQKDPNASKVTDYYNISIDGKMTKFPATFKELDKTFDFYDIFIGKYDATLIDADPNTTIEYPVSYFAKLTNDKESGEISFTFKPKEEQAKLRDCVCSSIQISMSSLDDKEKAKTIKFALPNNIQFGTDYNTIREIFELTTINTNISEDSKTWTISATNLDQTVLLNFSGANGGLYSVKMTDISDMTK